MGFARVDAAALDRLVAREAAGELKGVTASTALLVLVALGAVWADRGGRCWPSHATIAERCGMSVRGVSRALDALRGAGLVTWVEGERSGRAQGPNVYTIHPVQTAERRSPVSGSHGAEGGVADAERRSPVSGSEGFEAVTGVIDRRSPMTEEPYPLNQNPPTPRSGPVDGSSVPAFGQPPAVNGTDTSERQDGRLSGRANQIIERAARLEAEAAAGARNVSAVARSIASKHRASHDTCTLADRLAAWPAQVPIDALARQFSNPAGSALTPWRHLDPWRHPDDCTLCDGTGYVYDEVADTSARCPTRSRPAATEVPA